MVAGDDYQVLEEEVTNYSKIHTSINESTSTL